MQKVRNKFRQTDNSIPNRPLPPSAHQICIDEENIRLMRLCGGTEVPYFAIPLHAISKKKKVHA